jgi:hypothetical protein
MEGILAVTRTAGLDMDDVCGEVRLKPDTTYVLAGRKWSLADQWPYDLQ